MTIPTVPVNQPGRPEHKDYAWRGKTVRAARQSGGDALAALGPLRKCDLIRLYEARFPGESGEGISRQALIAALLDGTPAAPGPQGKAAGAAGTTRGKAAG